MIQAANLNTKPWLVQNGRIVLYGTMRIQFLQDASLEKVWHVLISFLYINHILVMHLNKSEVFQKIENERICVDRIL